MVQAFLSEVLGWSSQDRGLFGHTNAYYGTVEQQGRLTLHLHSLIWITNALSPQEIRDRIMKPRSRFRLRLIKYLEDCHRAEYFNGSYDAVIAKRKVPSLEPDADSDDELDLKSSYRPPTQTFPKAPPPPCTSPSCTEFCSKCKRYADWWQTYELEVDDLLVRSNKWRLKKLRKEANFKVRRERKGCLTKAGICRARFPRDVFHTSEIHEDGHINVRHVEPMMNTVNPVLTFLNRCNSDVTSLLSGTAVKAVVSYVSDYISKLSLKSYQMFASVYDVFEKNSEIVGGSERSKDNSRHLMRKMVNSMSAKMEIGSPMASMYILGNPDHYSSHSYVAFAWRPYVQFVRSFWTVGIQDDPMEEGRDDDERIPIGRQDGKFVTTSNVDDYRFRPVVYSAVNLYEWIQCAEKKKRTPKERAEFEEEIKLARHYRSDYYKAAMKRLTEDGESLHDEYDALEDDMDYEDQSDEDDFSREPSQEPRDDVSDWETDDEDEKVMRHPFLTEHGLFSTHSVTCNFEKLTKMIPNFIGGAIPRSDKGDRAAYCMTMLTLFKPWRSPLDLKDPTSTWDQAFKEHCFTDRQLQLMRNFDVRYKCNDARDDHFAQMKKKMAEARTSGKSLFPAGFMGHKDKFAEDLNDFDYGSDDEDMERDHEDDIKGPRTLRMLAEAIQIKNIMETSGWLDAAPDGYSMVDLDPVMPPARTRMEWVNIVKHQRMELTANKLANMPPISEIKKIRKVRNNTTILPPDYFNHRSKVDPVKNADIISSVIMNYELNKEQTRAFRIVVDHAS
ncbi:hypothetical protein B0H19DRAFT_952479, partial [Mycena capillaripes]